MEEIEYRNMEEEGYKFFSQHSAEIVEIGYECGFDADEAVRIFFERYVEMSYEMQCISNRKGFLNTLTTLVEKDFEKER
jgi:hypothetical protein